MSRSNALRSKRFLVSGVFALAGVRLLASCGSGGTTFIPGSDASAGAAGAISAGGAAGGATGGGSSGGAAGNGGGTGGSDGSGGAGGSVTAGGAGGNGGVGGDTGSGGAGGSAGSAGSAGTSGSAGAAGNGGSAGAPQGPVVKIFGEVPDATHSGVTSDTKIRGDNASTQTYDYGGGWFFGPDANPITYALLRFDISVIPSNAIVSSGILEIWTGACSNCQGNPNTRVDISELFEAWTEGSADSEVTPTAGYANWTHRSAGTPWSAPGAQSPSSSAGTLAMFFPHALDTKYSVNLSAMVQYWVTLPSTNHGLLLKMDDPDVTDGVAFVSSENNENAGAPAKRPRLVVQYELP